MNINKGATGSPSLSKTKGSLAGATRKSAGLGLVLCHCAGNTRPHDRSAGWACVVAFRHPQVFSFPSAGIVGSPALGCCAPPAGDTTVRPIHSVCRFPPPATAKCHGLRCSFACGLALPLGPFVIPVSGHYRLIVFCRHPPFTQRARCARDTSQIPAHRDAARNRILLVERSS